MNLPHSLPPGFEVPLHRSLTEPILLGGAPRTVAIANGTLAAAVGLGLQLWVPGLVLAFGDTSGGFRKLIQIVFGLSIAFAASSFFLSFFSFSGGAVLA